MATKLMVIDDDPAIRRLLRRALAGDGYDVVEAGDGAGAVELILKERPALVLLDMNMPTLDGLAALSEIREACPGVKIVMVTADADRRREQLAFERGASDYIAKPLDLQDLKDTVSHVLGGA